MSLLAIAQELARLLASRTPPPDPSRTMVFCDSNLVEGTRAVNRVRYASVEPIPADSLEQIREAARGRDDLDCLMLAYHGAEGQMTIGHAPAHNLTLTQLGDQLAPIDQPVSERVRVGRHIVIEGCNVGQDPVQMNVLANRLGAQIIDCFDFFQGLGQLEVSNNDPRPRNDEEAQALKDKIAAEIEASLLGIGLPGVSDSFDTAKRYVLGGDAGLETFKDDLFQASKRTTKTVTRKLWTEQFNRDIGDPRHATYYGDMLAHRLDVHNADQAEAHKAQWDSLERPTQGRIVRVHKWPLSPGGGN